MKNLLIIIASILLFYTCNTNNHTITGKWISYENGNNQGVITFNNDSSATLVQEGLPTNMLYGWSVKDLNLCLTIVQLGFETCGNINWINHNKFVWHLDNDEIVEFQRTN